MNKKAKTWKRKVLTYNPESFDLKTNSLEDIANTMVKSALDHWINEIISLTTLLFAINNCEEQSTDLEKLNV